jgi:hypothetical protein
LEKFARPIELFAPPPRDPPHANVRVRVVEAVPHEAIAVVKDLDKLAGFRLVTFALETVNLTGVNVGAAGKIVGLKPDGAQLALGGLGTHSDEVGKGDRDSEGPCKTLLIRNSTYRVPREGRLLGEDVCILPGWHFY